MSARRIYLDHAATTPPLPRARKAWLDAAGCWANPSSPHAEGRAARSALEDARARLKVLLGWPGEAIFTSGASEALEIALTRAAMPLMAVSAIEHDAVLRHADGAERLPVDSVSSVDPESAGRAGLVAVQHVNSETGAIQPLEDVARAARAAGGVLLADCAQSAGKIALPDADMIAIGAHKFGGPVGVGALLVRDWSLLKPGGGQERGYRGGTEDLPGACAMVAALEAGADWLEEAARLRALLDEAVVAAGGEVVADGTPRIPTIASYRMPGKPSAVQLIRFDAMGFAVSAGSACSSGTLKTSHVLAAMRYPHAAEVVRVSLGRDTREDEVRDFISAWRALADGGQARAAS